MVCHLFSWLENVLEQEKPTFFPIFSFGKKGLDPIEKIDDLPMNDLGGPSRSSPTGSVISRTREEGLSPFYEKFRLARISYEIGTVSNRILRDGASCHSLEWLITH